MAVSYHIQAAIVGVAPNLEIDFSKVVFSKGELLGPWASTLAVQNPVELFLEWEANVDTA